MILFLFSCSTPIRSTFTVTTDHLRLKDGTYSREFQYFHKGPGMWTAGCVTIFSDGKEEETRIYDYSKCCPPGSVVLGPYNDYSVVCGI